MGGDSNQQTPPAAPDIAKLYRQGIDLFLEGQPKLTAAEQEARATLDPQRIAAQQALQQQYGPVQYQQQLDALHQFDPESWGIRKKLADTVLSDLNAGYDLPDDYNRELTSQIRGAQAARGNTLGQSAGGAEAAFKGKAALDLYQSRLANAGAFLSGPTPEQQSLAIQAVQPDRSAAYTNPSAGYQGVNAGLANYQNLLAQFQLAGGQQGGGNAWQRALHGAQMGSQFGPWAAVGGAVDGAINGPVYSSLNDPNGSIGGAFTGGAWNSGNNYYWSDIRLKENIETVGQSPNGHRIVEFNYKSDPNKRRCRGTIAHEVLELQPEAVRCDENGFLMVAYDKIDVMFSEVTHAMGYS